MLADMAERTSHDNEAYITPAEASAIAFLSVKQLTRLADDGRIRFIRPGRHRRYHRGDVEALLSPERSAS